MSLNQQMAMMNKSINDFFTFIFLKLQNYKNISLGEQVAYPAIGFGLLLIITSLILFILK